MGGKILRNHGCLFLEKSLEMGIYFRKIAPRYGNGFLVSCGTPQSKPNLSTPGVPRHVAQKESEKRAYDLSNSILIIRFYSIYL